MVKEKKTGKMFAMKCVKKKQKIDLNLENEITVMRRYIFFSQYSVWDRVTMSSFLFFLLLEICWKYVNYDSNMMKTHCYFNRIKHDNIVGMDDFYESRTHYYLVMQL